MLRVSYHPLPTIDIYVGDLFQLWIHGKFDMEITLLAGYALSFVIGYALSYGYGNYA